MLPDGIGDEERNRSSYSPRHINGAQYRLCRLDMRLERMAPVQLPVHGKVDGVTGRDSSPVPTSAPDTQARNSQIFRTFLPSFRPKTFLFLRCGVLYTFWRFVTTLHRLPLPPHTIRQSGGDNSLLRFSAFVDLLPFPVALLLA